MTIPADTVPDGAALAPHHAYVGLLLALLAVALVWDDVAGKEPWVAVVGIGLALFAFASIWPFYDLVGAVLSLLGVAVAVVAPDLGLGRQHNHVRFRHADAGNHQSRDIDRG